MIVWFLSHRALHPLAPPGIVHSFVSTPLCSTPRRLYLRRLPPQKRTVWGGTASQHSRAITSASAGGRDPPVGAMGVCGPRTLSLLRSRTRLTPSPQMRPPGERWERMTTVMARTLDCTLARSAAKRAAPPAAATAMRFELSSMGAWESRPARPHYCRLFLAPAISIRLKLEPRCSAQRH